MGERQKTEDEDFSSILDEITQRTITLEKFSTGVLYSSLAVFKQKNLIRREKNAELRN